jgi:hypothetical protein
LSKINFGTILLISAPFLIFSKTLRSLTVGAAAVVILYSAFEKIAPNISNFTLPNLPTIITSPIQAPTSPTIQKTS